MSYVAPSSSVIAKWIPTEESAPPTVYLNAVLIYALQQWMETYQFAFSFAHFLEVRLKFTLNLDVNLTNVTY